MKFNYTEAEHVARRVLEDCGLDDVADFDMYEIILGRGAFYQEKPLKDKEGEIVSKASLI